MTSAIEVEVTQLIAQVGQFILHSLGLFVEKLTWGSEKPCRERSTSKHPKSLSKGIFLGNCGLTLVKPVSGFGKAFLRQRQ